MATEIGMNKLLIKYKLGIAVRLIAISTVHYLFKRALIKVTALLIMLK